MEYQVILHTPAGPVVTCYYDLENALACFRAYSSEGKQATLTTSPSTFYKIVNP